MRWESKSKILRGQYYNPMQWAIGICKSISRWASIPLDRRTVYQWVIYFLQDFKDLPVRLHWSNFYQAHTSNKDIVHKKPERDDNAVEYSANPPKNTSKSHLSFCSPRDSSDGLLILSQILTFRIKILFSSSSVVFAVGSLRFVPPLSSIRQSAQIVSL